MAYDQGGGDDHIVCYGHHCRRVWRVDQFPHIYDTPVRPLSDGMCWCRVVVNINPVPTGYGNNTQESIPSEEWRHITKLTAYTLPAQVLCKAIQLSTPAAPHSAISLHTGLLAASHTVHAPWEVPSRLALDGGCWRAILFCDTAHPGRYRPKHL